MGMQVVLAVNKCENVGKADEQAADFWALGLSPIAISAISGTGTGDLMDALVRSLPLPPPVQVPLPPGHVATPCPPSPRATRMLAWRAASSSTRLLSQVRRFSALDGSASQPLVCWGLWVERWCRQTVRFCGGAG